jgi:hypothetical protein
MKRAIFDNLCLLVMFRFAVVPLQGIKMHLAYTLGTFMMGNCVSSVYDSMLKMFLREREKKYKYGFPS